MTARRFRRPLSIVLCWTACVLLALLASPRPPAAAPRVAASTGLYPAFHIHPEPALLVFHRVGGLTPPDRAYLIQKGIDAEELRRNCGDGGQPCALASADSGRLVEDSAEISVAIAPAATAEIPTLRARLQGAPAGLEVYVTGAAALAYDAALAWQRKRYLILAGVAFAPALAAMGGSMGFRRAFVVGASAGGAATLSSALAALLATPGAVALSAVFSGGLAAGWAVHLLTPRWFTLPKPRSTPTTPTTRPVALPPAAAPAPKPLSLLQRAIIQAGEGALLQALIIAAGLSGLLFDPQSGLALWTGLAVAVSFSLSATPALIALLTQPYPPRPLPAAPPRRALRLALATLLAAGLFGLRPGAHPLHSAPLTAESARGYILLQQEEMALGRLLPFHLLIQSSGAARSEAGLAALRGLAAALETRPAIARVEGAAALRPLTEQKDALDPSEQAARLARLGARADELETRLNEQRASLSLLTASASPTASTSITLTEAGAQLARVSADLAEARVELIRAPTEFPEIAPRMDDVPALRALPDTLESAVAGLEQATARLEQVTAQESEADFSETQALLEESLAEIETLAAEAAALRDELAAAEAVWAGAALGDAAPLAPNPYLVSHDLIRLSLIPAGDPYAAGALDEAEALLPAARETLAGGPLRESELNLAGASAAAAERRARVLRGQLLPGVGAAALGVALFAWGALSQAGAALRLAVGAALSVASGLGITSLAVSGNVDASVLTLAGVTLIAMMGGRLAAGPATPTVEILALALPPLSLLLAGVATWAAIGVSLSGGLLAGHFLIAPALAHRPWLNGRR